MADFDGTLEAYAALLGEVFDIGDDGSRISATLVEARSLREVQGAGRRSRQFSLVWCGPHEPLLPQRIYTVRHAAFDAIDLFLVPVGRTAEGVRYEAVFT